MSRLKFAFHRFISHIGPYSESSVRYIGSIRFKKKFWREAVLLASVALFFVYWNAIKPPSDFPSGVVITIPEGASVSEITTRLQSRHVLSSGVFFKAMLFVTGFDYKIRSGDYVFSRPNNIFGVTHALITGDFGLEPVKVTIPEGATSFEIADILHKKLGTDQAAFLAIAKRSEGYLFPDTYFFLPNASPEHIVRTLQDTFFEKIKPYQEQLTAEHKNLDEIVTMASLLEKEAYTEEQKKNISAILWRRISINMPLQVDAVFGYIYQRPTFHPKLSNLAVDSPYNTYKYKGLPPGPIANPGLVSIDAALNPAKNEFLFYLSDSHGVIHYSKKFEEHVQKKNLYIN